MNIVIDPDLHRDELRRELYAGHLVILTRLHALSALVDYTRDELTELFRPHDPRHVHEHIGPADMAKILGAWKPRYIHSEKSRKLVRAVIQVESGYQERARSPKGAAAACTSGRTFGYSPVCACGRCRPRAWR